MLDALGCQNLVSNLGEVLGVKESMEFVSVIVDVVN